MEFDTEWTTFPRCPHCGECDQDWWDSLEYDHKVELMEKVHPLAVVMIEVDEMWLMMDDEEKYEVYCADDNEVEPTEDEKRANAGCDEAHRIMVEGREIG